VSEGFFLEKINVKLQVANRKPLPYHGFADDEILRPL
jgi:hypothetical protein